MSALNRSILRQQRIRSAKAVRLAQLIFLNLAPQCPRAHTEKRRRRRSVSPESAQRVTDQQHLDVFLNRPGKLPKFLGRGFHTHNIGPNSASIKALR